MTERVVIAGAGHAAGQVVASLKMQKFDGEIVLVGDEPHLPYQRPPLSKKFLSGDLPAERRADSVTALRTLGGASVAMGVVAVLLGMIGVFNSIAATSGQAHPAEMAFGIAGLMIAPLYGVAVRVFLWDPLASALEGAGEDVGSELSAAD